MSSRRGRGRMGICARCHRDRPIMARQLCGSCYVHEHKAGRHIQWPLTGRMPKPPPPPLDPNAPQLPQVLACEWCATPLTRSRDTGDEPLYEVYTVAGSLVAVCFEACPTDRVLELTEVSHG